VPTLNINPEVDADSMAAIFKKWYDVITPATDGLITMKENHTEDNIWSKSKSEVKFQYGDRPFSETGSSFISAVDSDISSKFGMEIDFHHLNRMQSQKN